jgi:hypothetical protein
MPSSFLCMQLPRRSLQNQMAATPMASLEREGPWRHRRDAGRQSEPLHLDLGTSTRCISCPLDDAIALQHASPCVHKRPLGYGVVAPRPSWGFVWLSPMPPGYGMHDRTQCPTSPSRARGWDARDVKWYFVRDNQPTTFDHGRRHALRRRQVERGEKPSEKDCDGLW